MPTRRRSRALSSEEKCEAYRRAGARIGEGVTLGRGAIVVAPRIVLEDGVSIGDGGDVRCEEVFAAGELSSFGRALPSSPAGAPSSGRGSGAGGTS